MIGPGFAGRPGWVLPQATAGGGASVAEEHRRAAEWTARLAAENARRAGAARKARALHAATEAPPEVASKADAEKAPEVRKPPQKSSVYLHGPVGTGKTMLMNLFYEASREAGCRTLRRHFYEFMMGLHRQIHQIQEERPVEVAANALADDIDVLCFDEFQVADIQDAAILPRLFEVLFLRGVTVVMTTNTAPQLLYTGGLNRHVHLPAFIRLLAEHCTVLGLGAKSVDYRRKAEAAELASGAARDAFLVGDKGLEQFAARWREMLEEVGLPEAEVVLKLPMGRQLSIPKAAGPACSISFQELCEGHRGEADFYALTERFRTIFLSGVPRAPVAPSAPKPKGIRPGGFARRLEAHSPEVSDRSASPEPGDIFLDDSPEELSEASLQRYCGGADLALVEGLEMRVDSARQGVDVLGSCLPALRRLRLSESSILCVRDLGTHLRHLEVLWLGRCGLQDLSGVTLMEGLRELYVPFNDVADVSSLKWLEHLEVLDLEGNALTDLEDLRELEKCYELRDLTLRDNPATFLPEFDRKDLCACLPQLETLDDLPVAEFDSSAPATPPGAATLADEDRFLDHYLNSDLDVYLDLYLAQDSADRPSAGDGLCGTLLVALREAAGLFRDEPSERQLLLERLKAAPKGEALAPSLSIASAPPGARQVTPKGFKFKLAPRETEGSVLTRGAEPMAGNVLSALRGRRGGEEAVLDLDIRELLRRAEKSETSSRHDV
ncbi:unnamed protein product [Effrenium voratum]|nr:unnamed protein product [Effrenium voratum]